MSMNKIEELFDQLDPLLETMNVPSMRRKDIAWLMRNLAINNADHQNFMEATRIINLIRKEQSNAKSQN